MRANDFASSPIDHYIQAQIVSQLYKQTERAFSDLKPDDVENSLFMYHMRKLINRGVVGKSNDGFKLTTKGIRWVNFIGPSTLQQKILPRLLINFFVTDVDKTQILLSQRKGPASTVLNEYLLPGGLYPYGLTKHTAARQILQDMNLPQDTPCRFVCVYEKLLQADDAFVHHAITVLYELTLDRNTQADTEHFALKWFSIDEVLNNTKNIFDEDLVLLIKNYRDGSLLTHDLHTKDK
jgi:hypothetical protein